jgi:signal transduction histidine kinase
MKTSRQPPRFFWQGVLIVLPVVVLAVVGFTALRQDKILAQHEATEKAQSLADEIARVLWSKLTARSSLDQFKEHSFRLDARGQPIFPPPAPELPSPRPLDPAQLNDAQRADWSAAFAPSPDNTASAGALDACRRFLESAPPAAFAAAARFRLGQLLTADKQFREAVAAFDRVAEEFPDATTESGLLLRPLAQLKAIELANANGVVDRNQTSTLLTVFCSNVVHRPIFLTPYLLARAAELEPSLGLSNIVGPWQSEWEHHEALRVLVAGAQAALATLPPGRRAASNDAPSTVPALFWFQALDLNQRPQSIFSPARLTVGGDNPYPRNSIGAVSFSGSPAPSTAEPSSAPARPFGRDLNRHWLAARLDDGEGGHLIVCRALGHWLPNLTDTFAESPTWHELRQALPPLPRWFDFSLDIAGITLVSSNSLGILVLRPVGKGAGQTWGTSVLPSPPAILASAHYADNGIELLRVNIHLVSPEMLFAHQQTRSRLFGLLIGTSALAALIGFVSARRAFRRQQQLADLKSNFVSSVSHELRAPIASVRLMAESLDRGKVAEPAKQREYFRFIVQECRRLGTLIENVLDFARIEQGRKQYEFEPTDLAELVRQTIRLMEPAATEREVTLELADLQPATLNLQPTLDSQAIQQALINLLDNAIKHSPPHSTVTVALDFSLQPSAFSL